MMLSWLLAIIIGHQYANRALRSSRKMRLVGSERDSEAETPGGRAFLRATSSHGAEVMWDAQQYGDQEWSPSRGPNHYTIPLPLRPLRCPRAQIVQ